MTMNPPKTPQFAGMHAALEAFGKAMPVVDPQIFRTQEIIGAQLQAAFEPMARSTNLQLAAVLEPLVRSMNLQFQAAVGLQEFQKQIARSIAPAMMAFERGTPPAIASMSQAISAMNFASQLPDLSVLSHFGDMVASGEFAPDFVQAAHEAVDGVEGFREEISNFSVRETVAGIFDAKTIAEGTYIFVFVIWLVGSLYMAGLGEEAKTISDAVGLTGAAGSHSVAKYITGKTTKVVIKKRNIRRR